MERNYKLYCKIIRGKFYETRINKNNKFVVGIIRGVQNDRIKA
ncbi:hypothetical protein J3E07_001593 [Methanococcus voltae]|uniref:Uncharacterized protein n=1 Tax=Methanococcus voltae TaxID=2188 RepID=A0A8J7UT20_METVO|nr:hypothetical protein [Methanococcus voltae]MBP2202152.1 hypothetical protein [Methanococcus voltae]